MSQARDRQSIFITGGAGFIGANVVRHFLDHSDCDLVVYDDLSTGTEHNLVQAIGNPARKERVRFVQGDILDAPRLKDSMLGSDIVIHLAAHTNVIESIRNPGASLAVNAEGTFQVLESCRCAGAMRFVFASSNAAVGEQDPPIHEGMTPLPMSPYGAVKLYGEGLCSAYFHSFGLKTVALRFSNVYGRYGKHKTSVVSRFLHCVAEGQELQIFGDGRQTRDFIYATDIAKAIYMAAVAPDEQEGIWGQVFQVGTGVETRIVDLPSLIHAAAGCVSPRLSFLPARRGEIRRNYSSYAKIERVLGFQPNVTLEEGLSDLAQSLELAADRNPTAPGEG